LRTLAARTPTDALVLRDVIRVLNDDIAIFGNGFNDIIFQFFLKSIDYRNK
jgi:hypothetical protein